MQANSFLKLTKMAAREEQLEFLLQETLNGDRQSFLVFLDLLEEENPKAREELNGKSLLGLFTVLSKICPTVIYNMEPGYFEFVENIFKIKNISMEFNTIEDITYENYMLVMRHKSIFSIGVKSIFKLNDLKFTSIHKYDELYQLFQQRRNTTDPDYIDIYKDDPRYNIIDAFHSKIFEKAEKDIERLKQLLSVPKTNEQIKVAQWRRNFDYGEGLYSNLDKYKSVTEFRRKRRKKRKKDIENILKTRPK